MLRPPPFRPSAFDLSIVRLPTPLAGAVLLLILVAAPALGADRPEFTGSWEYSGSASERAARVAAMEAVVAEAPRLLRSFVRGRLEANTAVPDRLELEVAACRMEVRPAGEAPVESRIGGPAVSYEDPTAGLTTVRRTIGADGILETGRRDGGSRSATYRLEQDLLLIDVELNADLLPAAVRYRLTYRRAGDAIAPR